VESEETEQRMIQEMDDVELPETHNIDVFQLVQRSKAKKMSPIKSSYATRGKTGLTKPFK
jgi:hypothetical protein